MLWLTKGVSIGLLTRTMGRTWVRCCSGRTVRNSESLRGLRCTLQERRGRGKARALLGPLAVRTYRTGVKALSSQSRANERTRAKLCRVKAVRTSGRERRLCRVKAVRASWRERRLCRVKAVRTSGQQRRLCRVKAVRASWRERRLCRVKAVRTSGQQRRLCRVKAELSSGQARRPRLRWALS